MNEKQYKWIPDTLDERIASLSPEIDEEFQTQLYTALQNIRGDNINPDVPLILLSGLIERLVDLVLDSIGEPRTYEIMYNLILRIGSGSKENPKIEGLHLMPDEKTTYLHDIRTQINKVRHHPRGFRTSTQVAETALMQFLILLEWFYCEYENGPRLKTIYTDSPVRAIPFQREPIIGRRFLDAGDMFKDRVDKVGQTRSLLLDRSVKFIGVVGTGGIGKTALVSKVCEEIESGKLQLSESSDCPGADGMIYLNCEGAEKPSLDRLFEAFGRVLGGRHRKDLRDYWLDDNVTCEDKIAYLCNKLQTGCYLLILDNLERLLDERNCIEDTSLRKFIDMCLATPHAIKVLAASRERLHTEEVTPALRWVILNEGLPPSDAVNMLRQLDPDNDKGLRDAPEELLYEVAERCFCIPHALRAVAGVLNANPVLSVEDLLKDEDLFNRQVVENLVERQYRDLSDSQRWVLTVLSVFSYPVPLEAVEYVVSLLRPDIDVKAELNSLILNYLVSYNRSAGTYELHPLNSTHAYNNIPETGDQFRKPIFHAYAAQYWNEKRVKYEETLEEQSTYLQWYKYEDPHWQFAVEQWLYHLSKTNEINDGNIAFARVYFDAFWWWGMFLKSRFCERLLDLWNNAQPIGEHKEWGRLLMRFHESYPEESVEERQGDWTEVRDSLLEMRKIAEIDGSPDTFADDEDRLQLRTISDMFLGDATRYLKDYAQSEKYYREAEELFEDESDKAWAKFYLADLYVAQAEEAKAEADSTAFAAFCSSALELASQTEDTFTNISDIEKDYELLSYASCVHADVLWLQGKVNEAFEKLAKTVFYAYIFNVYPSAPPDQYTQYFYRYMVRHTMLRLEQLIQDGRKQEAVDVCLYLRNFFAAYWDTRQSAFEPARLESLLTESRYDEVADCIFPPEPSDDDLENPEADFIGETQAVADMMMKTITT